MARLEDTQGRWLELTPLRYQFEWHECDYVEDANWLVLRFAAHDGTKAWQCRQQGEPAFQTWSAAALIAWLRGILDGRVGDDDQWWRGWRTMEKLIGFEASVEDSVLHLDAVLNGEFLPLPDEEKYHHAEPLRIAFTPSLDHVRTFMEELEVELKPFPERSVRAFRLAIQRKEQGR